MDEPVATKRDVERLHERLDRLVDDHHEHWEEIVKLVAACSNCSPRLAAVDRAVWEDAGIGNNGSAGGLVAVVRNHHQKLKERDDEIRWSKRATITALLGLLVSIVLFLIKTA